MEIELLAPAGTLEAGLTALNYGADAVYTGLSKFNARERGRNLSFEELSRLIAYAHGKNKKVYVTLNTLIKEGELNDVVDVAEELSLIRPDAVIVQDIGVVRLFREYFPEISVHGSTQMGVHNSAGVKFAEKVGISRVILERQVSFEEIAEIHKETSVELEVFIHGALCCSRSGACLFSSWHGGWSGNRGKCKQPCRRRYYSRQGNGFFFSPGDLCSIDDIETLKKLGVSSLKIEGRLRKTDYVKAVVSAYRLALDSGGDRNKMNEAKKLLGGAIGRKRLPPFKTEREFSQTVNHKNIGASGLKCGIVVRAERGRFLVETSRKLNIYDTIRIQPKSGDEGPLMTITKMYTENQHGKKRVWIFCDKRVEKNSVVFKTGHAGGEMGDVADKLTPAKPKIDLNINVCMSGIAITSPILPDLKWQSDANIMHAEKRPLDNSKIIEEFAKSDKSQFSAGTIEPDIDGALFIPAGELKRLRREFWHYVNENITHNQVADYWKSQADKAESFINNLHSAGPEKPRKTFMVSKSCTPPEPDCVVCTDINNGYTPENEIALPDFCGEFELRGLRSKINKAYEAGCRKFRVTSLYGLEMLAGYSDLSVTTSYMLPACNSMSVAELKQYNVSKVQAWIELEKKSLDALLAKCGEDMEIYCYGRLKLLSTRLRVPAPNEFTDGRGAEFYVDRHNGMTDLYPNKIYGLERYENYDQFYDMSHTDDKLLPADDDFNHDRDFT